MRKFDKRFFDGSRLTGYGGYYYNKILVQSYELY